MKQGDRSDGVMVHSEEKSLHGELISYVRWNQWIHPGLNRPDSYYTLSGTMVPVCMPEVMLKVFALVR